MAKILITGPLGHIGSKFIHNLKKDDFDEVRLLDNLSTQRYASLFNLPEGINFNFYEDDICTANLENYFKDIDIVLHLAAITDASNSFEIAEQVEKVNFEGTKRVVEGCISCGCRLIFPSTTSVYGSQEAIVDENCSILDLKPQSPYADSKLKAEQMIQDAGQRKKLQFIILRFGTICGVSIGMRFHTAINKFVWQASLGLPITVWRTALDQKRPYLYLGDAIRAIEFIIKKNNFDNKIYNVLNSNMTVKEIIDLIKSQLNDIKIEYVDSPIMNQLSYTVLCEQFKTLGFNFTGTIKQGILETIEILKNTKNK